MRHPFSSLDPNSQAHRYLLIAAEQAVSGRALVGCGTALKALDSALKRHDYPAVLLTCGFFSDVLGVAINEPSLTAWQESAPQFAKGWWSGRDIQYRWQGELRGYALRAQAEVFRQLPDLNDLR